MSSRKSVTVGSVTTSWTEVQVLGFPDKFIITRAKAELISGSGTMVALSIRQRSAPTLTEDIALEYDLASDIDDEIRNGVLVMPVKRRDTDIASIYVACKSDSGTTNKVRVTLEYHIP